MIRVLMFAVGTIACALATACNDAPSSSASGSYSQSVQFATADELFEHVHTLLSESPQRGEEFLALFYLENEWQHFEHEVWSEMFLSYLDLNRAALERFGQAFWIQEVQVWPNDQFHFRERGEERAIVQSLDPNGNARDLHFVKIGDEWMISGYSWELLGGSAPTDAEKQQQRDRFERMKSGLQANHAIDRTIAANIRAGKYRSFEEAVADRDQRHRERPPSGG